MNLATYIPSNQELMLHQCNINSGCVIRGAMQGPTVAQPKGDQRKVNAGRGLGLGGIYSSHGVPYGLRRSTII